MNSPDADPVENFSASAKRVRLGLQSWVSRCANLVVLFRCFVSLFRGLVMPPVHTCFSRALS